MRELVFNVRLDVSADKYWALRGDRNFDHFCAVEDEATFTLLEEGVDGERCYVEATYEYASKLPASAVLGNDVKIWSRLDWHPQKYDESEPATFVSIPDVFGRRLRTSGTCHCVPLSADACELRVRAAIEVRILGLGRVLEATLASVMRDNYAKLNSVVLKYLATQSGDATSPALASALASVVARDGCPESPPSRTASAASMSVASLEGEVALVPSESDSSSAPLAGRGCVQPAARSETAATAAITVADVKAGILAAKAEAARRRMRAAQHQVLLTGRAAAAFATAAGAEPSSEAPPVDFYAEADEDEEPAVREFWL